MAKSKTVYRLNSTGALISKKKALKLDKSLYTVEKMATSGHKPARTRTVYRNTLTGLLISKEEALALAASAYTIEQMPVTPADPLVQGLDVDLTGNWGVSPVLSAAPRSNEKRGTIIVKAGDGASGPSGWTLTFKHAKHAAPFALVLCNNEPGCTYTVSKTALTVTSSFQRTNPATGAVYDYRVDD